MHHRCYSERTVFHWREVGGHQVYRQVIRIKKGLLQSKYSVNSISSLPCETDCLLCMPTFHPSHVHFDSDAHTISTNLARKQEQCCHHARLLPASVKSTFITLEESPTKTLYPSFKLLPALFNASSRPFCLLLKHSCCGSGQGFLGGFGIRLIND